MLSALGASWGSPGTFLVHLVGSCGGSWRLLGGLLGLAWAALAPLDVSWAPWGPCWDRLVGRWVSLGGCWRPLGASWPALGASWLSLRRMDTVVGELHFEE